MKKLRAFLDFFSARRHVHAHVFWSIFISSLLIAVMLIGLFAWQSLRDISEIQKNRVVNIADSVLHQIDASADTIAQTHSVVFSSDNVYAYISAPRPDVPALDWYYLYKNARNVLVLTSRGQSRLIMGMALYESKRDSMVFGNFYTMLDPYSLEADELNRPIWRGGALFFVSSARKANGENAYLVTQIMSGAYAGYYEALIAQGDALTILDTYGREIARAGEEAGRGERAFAYEAASKETGVRVRVSARLPSFWGNLAAGAPWLLPAALCALAGSLALSLGFSFQMISGFRTMQENIRLVENEQYDSVRLIEREDEMGSLSETFSRMAGHIARLIQENRLREEKKHELEIQVLRAQVSPHFLYNSLNSIRQLAQMQGMDHIEKLTLSIIGLLKASLNTGEFMVPVGQELEYVRNYCEICRYQFVHEFSLAVDVDDSAKGLKILHMALQPIVENSIIHGFADEKKGEIRIRAAVEGEKLRVTVSDNGRGMTKEQLDGLLKQQRNTSRMRFSGIGVNNVRDRIRLRFGEEYDLTVESEVGKFTRVSFTLPVVREEEA